MKYKILRNNTYKAEFPLSLNYVGIMNVICLFE